MKQLHPEDFCREVTCNYGEETFRVGDNGAIFRCGRVNARRRPLDEKWTFGRADKTHGYMCFSSVRVHSIVATAFHGPKPSKDHVVDHIDTNRRNNRPENLRWVTRLENILLNPITARRVKLAYGSIENFLANPDRPKPGSLDPDFEWMRSVTKEEADESHNRLLDWAKSGGMPSGGSLGEWVFESRSKPAITNSGVSDIRNDSKKEQSWEELLNERAQRESRIKAKVSRNLDRAPTRLPVIWRGLAQHVDYCPLEMRNWKGKPYANFIDDCVNSPCCASSEEGYVLCIGGRSIESQDEYEQWKTRTNGEAGGSNAAL